MEKEFFTKEQRAEFIYLQRDSGGSTLSELGEVLGITRERVRQLDREYRRCHALPPFREDASKGCASCGQPFKRYSARAKFCGSLSKKQGCVYDRLMALKETDEYKKKREEYRLAHPYVRKPIVIFDRVCANKICNKEFQTARKNQKYCGSYSKKDGCSFYNQTWHKRVNPKQRYCQRCGVALPIQIDLINKRKGNQLRYCGWADLNKHQGEGCRFIVRLWSYYNNGNMSQKTLYKYLLRIKDPKLGR